MPTSERLVVLPSNLIGDVQRVIGRDSDGSREIKQSVESHGRIRVETFTRHLLTVALGISTYKEWIKWNDDDDNDADDDNDDDDDNDHEDNYDDDDDDDDNDYEISNWYIRT